MSRLWLAIRIAICLPFLLLAALFAVLEWDVGFDLCMYPVMFILPNGVDDQ
jgi:hypothetical protein